MKIYLLRHGLADETVYQQVLDGTLGVHPTFLYESLWNLLGVVLLVLIARRGRKFNGQLFLSYIVWYGLGRAAIEGLRTDSLYFFGTPLRSSQALGLASALVAVIVMAVRFKTAGPPTPPSYAAAQGGQADDSPPWDEADDGPAPEEAPQTGEENDDKEDEGHGSDPDGR